MKLFAGSLILAAAAALSLAAVSSPGHSTQVAAVPRVAIEATGRGFVPDTVRLTAGRAAELVFTRTTSSGCVAQVHIPDLGVGRTDLPQNVPVVIRVTPEQPGAWEFRCGMDMHRGVIIVSAD
jgi:plastocyanin domain-containing protein